MATTYQLTEEDIVWDYRKNPTFRVGTEDGGYGTTVEIYPQPGYTHDIELAASLLQETYEKFPVPNVKMYIANRESTSGTNGWAQEHTAYYDDTIPEDKKHQQLIFLNGKPTPIHPAVTMYLVPHEYGHCVEYWLQRHWGEEKNYSAIKDAYKKVRNLEPPKYYGPGTWHLSTGEIFANDFRVCVTKREVEFWPHPTVDRPSGKIEEWWKRVAEDPGKERWDELRELAEDV